MSAFVRDAHIGLVSAYGRVNTGISADSGGRASTFTVRVDSAVVPVAEATTFSTYSPVSENVAVVVAADASAKVTSPGPETLLQVAIGAGPTGSAATALPRPAFPRPARGAPPYPTQPLRYVLPPCMTTRSTPAADASGRDCADKTPSGPNAAATLRVDMTDPAAADPSAASISRRVMGQLYNC